MKMLTEFENQALPAPTDLPLRPFPARTLGAANNLESQQPAREMASLITRQSWPVILTTHPGLELQRSHTRAKRPPSPSLQTAWGSGPHPTESCDLLSDLRLLFRKTSDV